MLASARRVVERSTAALIFNVFASAASLVVMFKRRWIIGIYVSVFFIGMSYFVISLVWA